MPRTIVIGHCAAVVLLLAGNGLVMRAAGQSTPAFDSIAYGDSGGFAGGGTGKSLAVRPDGTVDAATRGVGRKAVQLAAGELNDLCAAIAAVDWPHVEHNYLTRGAADLVSRDLVIVVRGNRYETHADDLAKLPGPLQRLFDTLDALYRRAGPSPRGKPPHGSAPDMKRLAATPPRA